MARRTANTTGFSFQIDLCAAAGTKGSHAGSRTSKFLCPFDEHRNPNDSLEKNQASRGTFPLY